MKNLQKPCYVVANNGIRKNTCIFRKNKAAKIDFIQTKIKNVTKRHKDHLNAWAFHHWKLLKFFLFGRHTFSHWNEVVVYTPETKTELVLYKFAVQIDQTEDTMSYYQSSVLKYKIRSLFYSPFQNILSKWDPYGKTETSKRDASELSTEFFFFLSRTIH